MTATKNSFRSSKLFAAWATGRGRRPPRFVPFFASLSFNRHSKVAPPARASEDRTLQRRLLDNYLAARPDLRRSGGSREGPRRARAPLPHPDGMLDARYKFWPCFFMLCDFGRYPSSIADVDKDVIAPYRHVVPNFANDSAGYDDRPTLLYFHGATRKLGAALPRR
uniref:Exostosin GT47 domain-containing protein n=1 Tax=Oryza nivara TaxID=4536 RepID=A0A0E0FHQ1_ORYNI